MRGLSQSVYVAAAMVVGACSQPGPAPVRAAADPPGYVGVVRPEATPDQELAALRARPDVNFTEQRGWTVAEDRANQSVWSFVPPGHPAYPAAVRRRTVQRNGEIFIDTKILCGASKPACDALAREFQQLNQAVRRDLRG